MTEPSESRSYMGRLVWQTLNPERLDYSGESDGEAVTKLKTTRPDLNRATKQEHTRRTLGSSLRMKVED